MRLREFMHTIREEPSGTIGDFGCYSFHETKNYSMGEGGALVFQNNDFLERAEIIREKGTDRSKFFPGIRWTNTAGWIMVLPICPAI